MEDPINHSQRMCRELDKIFPDFNGRQRELMLYLCLVAYGSEIYDGVCEDAWLRTIIKLKTCVPGVDTFEVMTGISNVRAPCTMCWDRLLKHEYSTAISNIEIRSNILPRQAYAEKLQESVVLDDRSVVLDGEEGFCCISGIHLYHITSINQACLEEVLVLKQKLRNESSRNTEKWDLTVHLRPYDVQQTVQIPPIDPNVLPLRRINPADVVSMEKDSLGGGSSAEVYKVLWRKGTYAMKWYKQNSFRPNERKYIESKIMHPHLVHGFGYFEKDEGCQLYLLMELLDKDLTRYAVEVVRACYFRLVKPLFSRSEDTFDVLLQIASAMKHLHLHNVIHGDLKPGNILLDHFEVLGPGQRFLAKVTDFGDSKVIEPGIAFKPAGYGTTQYAAPELLKLRKGVHAFDHPKKIDVYGFGAIAHEILTGYPVYEGRDDVHSLGFKNEVISGKLKPSGCIKWRLLKWIMRFKAWKLLGLKERFPEELMELVESCWELHPENRPDFSDICRELTKCKSSIQVRDRRAEYVGIQFIAALFLLGLIFLASLIKVLLPENYQL